MMRWRLPFGDRRGVTMVEFAILSPALIALLCGTIELAHLMLARSVLDGAVVDAARLATASMETGETDRTEAMAAGIREAMEPFPLEDGKIVEIETKVFSDFSSVAPEYFRDGNGNGEYDLGEDFTDRNNNKKWDPSTPIDGTLGGPGDVVSYTAVYPKAVLFRFLIEPMGGRDTFDLRATTVVRNETVARRTGS